MPNEPSTTNPSSEQISERGLRWSPRYNDSPDILSVYQREGYSIFDARLFDGRTVSAESAKSYLNPRLRDFMPDPSSLTDMDKAVAEIWEAVDEGRSITVFADYDVDGATSAAQLIRWGQAINCEIGLYVPDRIKEGYGPTIGAFEQLKDEGVETIITVDCGAASEAALIAAKDLGIDIIVIDHHIMGEEIPPCKALVNPNRQDDESGLGDLAAAGVVFMLLVALNREGRRRGLADLPDLMEFLPLAALGTICDVMPLKGLNRAITRQGLAIMPHTRFEGLRALARVSGRHGSVLRAVDMGFGLGPRINAGGRIGEASMGGRLLTTDDPVDAETMANNLNRVNAERQDMQKAMLDEAMSQARQADSNSQVIITAMEGWHAGIIGIVAGRLKDQFGKPAIVIGFDHNDLGKGSGRSIDGVDLGAAIIAAREEGLLSKGGGHAMAAGLSVPRETFPQFCGFIEDRLSADVIKARETRSLKYDGVIGCSAVAQELLDRLEPFEPFGRGNPTPVFMIEDVEVTYANRLKNGHVRCSFQDRSGGTVSGICFGAEDKGLSGPLLSANPPRIDLLVKVMPNEYQGRKSVDIHIQDIRLRR